MKPCTRCGECCHREVCPLGIEFSGSSIAPCRALEESNGLHSCGLVTNTSRFFDLGGSEKWRYDFMSEQLRAIFGFGRGCDSVLAEAAK